MNRALPLFLLLFFSSTGISAEERSPHSYVGSKACVSCHEKETKGWKNSHHYAAWTESSKETVLGDFKDKSFTQNGVVTKFSENGGKYFYETDGPEGIEKYPVKEVIGITPLQQYVLETEPGRYQSHDVVWDTEKNKWYHLYPELTAKGGDGLHWTGPYKNWNSRCAVCHATDYQTNYDPKSKKYSSEQTEKGVGCEACHGPGSGHLSWAESSAKESDTKKGFTFLFDEEKRDYEINTCAPCHSRREAITDSSAPPGEPFDNYHRLALLREGLYFPDGQIDDEVYVYGSFLQSEMYEKGVRCSDCHNVHSGNLKVEGDNLCLQCHNSGGNKRFPTLHKKNYQSSKHHFHKEGSKSAECTSCHMTGKFYMGVDFRHDHSFRIPRPDLSVKFDLPNACNGCHGDKSASWAAEKVKRWYPDGEWKNEHYGEIFGEARKGLNPKVVEKLVNLSLNRKESDIVRATALNMISRGEVTPELADRFTTLLRDESPLIRAEAAFLQYFAEPDKKVARLIPLTSDPAKVVRLSTARALLTAPLERLSDPQRKALSAVMKEYRESLLQKTDFPESHMQMGGMAMSLKNFSAADAAFSEATRLDPQLVSAWLVRARMKDAVGKRGEAKEIIRDALKRNIGHDELSRYLRSLEIE